MKTTNCRNTIFSLAVKGSLLLIAALAILPYSIKAQCTRWDVSGKWILNVDKGASETLDLIQEGINIKGKSLLGLGGVPVQGTVEGNDFTITIDWERPGYTVSPGAASFEIFKGKIGSDGIIHGFGSTRNKPDLVGDKNPWSSNRPMVCAESSRYNPIHKLKITPSPSKAPDAPPAKTVEATGDPKATAETNGGSAGAPQISASPTDGAFVPGKIAHTVIRWDGGPDHPYAELWVRVDDQDEKFVIEQGRGSRQMVVEPGKTYLYILTDSGVRLATVTVKFH